MNINIVPFQNWSVMVETIAKSSLIITSKLHVGIVSIAQGGKVISIPAHEKTFRLYKQLGLSDFCIQKGSLNETQLISTIRKLEYFSPHRATIRDGIRLIDQGLENFLNEV